MEIRVVAGTGRGPTETAAYDAALLDAGVGNYNLVRVSSVLPADASVERRDGPPEADTHRGQLDLGRVGDRLTVVEASAVAPAPASVGAALYWARTDGGEGLFYEAGAVGDADAVPATRRRAETEAERGLAAGFDRRGWTAADRPVGSAHAVRVRADDDDRDWPATVGGVPVGEWRDGVADDAGEDDATEAGDQSVADGDGDALDVHGAAVVLAVYGVGEPVGVPA